MSVIPTILPSVTLLLLISPLIGFLINGLFGKWLRNSEKLSGWIACFAVLVSFVCSVIVFTSTSKTARS